jgi:DNA-directed RNA polymerase alpha subunit
LLNIKQIILTSDFEFFPQVGFLNVKGPGIVQQVDLKLPNFIYLVDPNQYIATLTINGSLSMKFVIACGKYITHTPGSSLNSNWVALLKKASPVPTPINLKKIKDFKV